MIIYKQGPIKKEKKRRTNGNDDRHRDSPFLCRDEDHFYERFAMRLPFSLAISFFSVFICELLPAKSFKT